MNITVLGNGEMGRGIVYANALKEIPSILWGRNLQSLNQSKSRIESLFDKAIIRGKLSPAEKEKFFSLISFTISMEEACSQADIIIETIVEVLSDKLQLFRMANSFIRKNTIIATNTSSFALSHFSEVIKNPSLFLGLHYFNPVYAMNFVEVIKTEATSQKALDLIEKYLAKLDKKNIVIKDSPGFVSTRLNLALASEAMRIVEEGVASVKDVDLAMREAFGHPMGPILLGDYVGLDVRLKALQSLYDSGMGEHFKPNESLKKLVSSGKYGRKSNQGYYRWDNDESCEI
jgi:3-hydroxybutyryl-CoA dehydrogenase